MHVIPPIGAPEQLRRHVPRPPHRSLLPCRRAEKIEDLVAEGFSSICLQTLLSGKLFGWEVVLMVRQQLKLQLVEIVAHFGNVAEEGARDELILTLCLLFLIFHRTIIILLRNVFFRWLMKLSLERVYLPELLIHDQVEGCVVWLPQASFLI